MDKDVQVYDYTTAVGDDGFVSRQQPTLSGQIKANVWFGQLEQVKKDYGLSEDIDGAMSTQDSLELNQLVLYNDRYYIVTEVLPFDHYNLIGLKKWQNQSQKALSA